METDGIKKLVTFLIMQRFCAGAPVSFVSAMEPFSFTAQAIENFLCAKSREHREERVRLTIISRLLVKLDF